jgi:hypothetical protein
MPALSKKASINLIPTKIYVSFLRKWEFELKTKITCEAFPFQALCPLKMKV